MASRSIHAPPGPRRPQMRPRHGRAAARRDGPYLIQLGLHGLICVYAILFPYLRGLGAAPLIVVLLCAATITAVGARKYIEPLLLMLAALGTAYAAVSYTGILHQGHTLMFETAAIPQQVMWVYALPALIPCFALFCQRIYLRDPHYLKLETFLLLICLAMLGWKLVSSLLLGRFSLGIGNMTNDNAFLAFILVRRITYSKWSSLAKWFAVAAMAISASTAQAKIVLGLLLGLRSFPRHARVMLIAFAIALVLAACVSVFYAKELWAIDPNTGFRAMFWKDVLSDTADTLGAGVGFGTETIRPSYDLQLGGAHVVMVDDGGFIYVGSHNAFTDALYRMGFLGFLLTAAYVIRHLYTVTTGGRAFTSFDCWVAGAMFTTIMVNVGFVSANFFFGVSLLLGWLRFRELYVQERKRLLGFARWSAARKAAA